VAVAGLSFASVLITSRALGADGRGEVAFLTTIAYLTAQLATLGIPQANVNLAGREPHRSPRLAGTSVVLAGALGAAAAGIVALLITVFPAAGGTSPVWLQALVLASVPMLVLQVCLVHLALAQYLFAICNTAWLVPPLLNATANGALAIFGVLSVEAAVGVWLVGQALATLLLVRAVVGRLGGFGRPERALAREMLAFGTKAHFGRVMLVGNYRVDQWILGAVAGPGPLGIYSVAVAWSESLFFLPTAFSSVQRPDLVRATPDEARHQAARSFRHALLLTIVLAVVLIALAPFLCVVIFGEEFRASIGPLRILALGAPGIIALKLFGNALTAQRKPLRETAAISVAFVSILALDVALIPRHGAGGAAIASSIAYTIGGVAAAVIFFWTFGTSRQRAATVSAGRCSPSDAAQTEPMPPRSPMP
jgi:O-antigen/teichoic acid export membrane protein